MRTLSGRWLGVPAALLSVVLPAQTVLRDIDPRPGVSSSPENVVKSGERIFFKANDGVNGRELWVSDGTAAGTNLVANLSAGSGSPGIENLVPVVGGVAFKATFLPLTNNLFFSDGTSAGTGVVTLPEIYGTGLYKAGGDRSTLYFVASTWAGAGGELYARDSGGAVTRLTDFHGTGPNARVIDLLVVHGRRAWFSVLFGNTVELWVYEPGSLRRIAFPSGTSMRNGSIPTAELGGRLWFPGFDAQTGVEPWVADPLLNTAWRVGDLEPGVGSSDPARFAAFGVDVVFTAVTLAAGQEIYRFQPNATAPVLVADVYPGPNSGVATWPLFASGGTLYFAGYQPTTGEELWRTDGTAAGTALVADLSPGSGWGSPGYLVAPVCDGGAVLFAGAEPTRGREMWLTNGTTAGTRLLFDLIPGAGSGVTAYGGAWATLLGTTWLFLGSTAATGDELFTFDASLTRAACATCPVAGCPGTNGVPRLTTRGQPTLGNAAFAVDLQSARAASTALFLLDRNGTSTPLPGGCTLFSGPAPVIAIHSTDAAGAATQGLAVPNQPWLLGVVLRTQWAVADPNGAFQQTLSMSNGCYLVLGS